MSELLKKQKFGVEGEFTGITRTMAAEAVAEILGSHATGPDRTCYRTYTIRDSKRRIWKVMRDSSICPVRKAGRELMDEYRVEFVTPSLNYEDIETLQTIIRRKRRYCAQVAIHCRQQAGNNHEKERQYCPGREKVADQFKIDDSKVLCLISCTSSHKSEDSH